MTRKSASHASRSVHLAALATLLFLAVATVAPSSGWATATAPEEATEGPAAGSVPAPPRIDAEVGVLSARDTLRIASVGSPTQSPDGQWVLYTKSDRDMEDEDLDSTTHVWRVGADGDGRRQMTRGGDGASSPAWFPDAERFAFLSSRSADGGGDGRGADGDGPKSQVWAMYLDGGEAWQVTEHEEAVQDLTISPDGTMIAFVSRDPLTDEEKERRKKKDDARVVDDDFRMSHLWVLDLDSGTSKRLTAGEFTVSDARWSPDSARIAYVTRPTPKVDDGARSDIWVVEVGDFVEGETADEEATDEEKAGQATTDEATTDEESAASEDSPEVPESRKLYDNPGPDTSPRWSPDGTTIAFASNPHEGTTTWYDKLHLVPADPAEDAEPRVLLQDFDRDFGSPIWAPDGERVYWATGDRATINFFSVDLDSGAVTRLDPPVGANYSWELSRDGSRWVWVHSGPTWPGEVYTAAAADGDVGGEDEGSGFSGAVRLSDANPWLHEEGIRFGDVEAVTWTNSDGQEIEGILTYPVGHGSGEASAQQPPYPLIVNPHGGPSGARTLGFSSTNQFFAGNGFLVLEPNFRGSSNYGQEFLNANRDYWGIRDYDDIMTGVDHVIAEGLADPDRMVAWGWSYGGYMTFWMSTQTDRFKVISPGAGLSNLYSMYSTTDIPRYLGWFFGTPWDNPDIYDRLSAIRHADQVRVKILILHGAEDARVPPEQSIEFYQALKDLGKDVTLVLYPREGHGIREPRHRMDRLRRYLFTFTEALGMEPVSEPEEVAAAYGHAMAEDAGDGSGPL